MWSWRRASASSYSGIWNLCPVYSVHVDRLTNCTNLLADRLLTEKKSLSASDNSKLLRQFDRRHSTSCRLGDGVNSHSMHDEHPSPKPWMRLNAASDLSTAEIPRNNCLLSTCRLRQPTCSILRANYTTVVRTRAPARARTHRHTQVCIYVCTYMCSQLQSSTNRLLYQLVLNCRLYRSVFTIGVTWNYSKDYMHKRGIQLSCNSRNNTKSLAKINIIME